MLVLFYMYKVMSIKVNELTFNEFMAKVSSGEVENVEVTPSNDGGVYYIEGKLKEYKENETFKVTAPLSDEVIKELVDGHKEYSAIEVASNLPKLLNGLIDSNSDSTNIPDFITDQILTASFEDEGDSSLATKFTSDELYNTVTGNEGSVLSLAVIDSDENNLALVKQIFETVGATVDTYSKGQEFSDKYEDGKYNLVILDVFILQPMLVRFTISAVSPFSGLYPYV